MHFCGIDVVISTCDRGILIRLTVRYSRNIFILSQKISYGISQQTPRYTNNINVGMKILNRLSVTQWR